MNRKIKSVVKMLEEGYSHDDIMRLKPTVSPGDITSALELCGKGFTPPPKVVPVSPTQLVAQQDISTEDREEALAVQMECIVTSVLSSMTSETILALTPREQVNIVANFIDKMRLLRGKSTDNIAINSIASIIERAKDADPDKY